MLLPTTLQKAHKTCTTHERKVVLVRSMSVNDTKNNKEYKGVCCSTGGIKSLNLLSNDGDLVLHAVGNDEHKSTAIRYWDSL